MNWIDNMIIDFRINGKHDHTIQKKAGRSVERKRATKKRKKRK